jgi:single-strand DNA-binding protein
MFDTPITMVGNVLTAPQWRRTTQTGTFLVTFRVAATSRRYVKEQGGWIDGDSLRVRVTCWRRLAENISVSVQLGDPVIVHGRLYTRDWVDESGARRSSYELEALAVGFDLARGVAKFARRRAVGGTDVIEGPASDARVGGELTEEVDEPGRPVDLPADNDLFEPFDPALYEVSTGDPGTPDPSAAEASPGAPVGVDGPPDPGGVGNASAPSEARLGDRPGTDAAVPGPEGAGAGGVGQSASPEGDERLAVASGGRGGRGRSR